MNIIEKITRSWWVILSFIPLFNGFGFLYIALKHNNRNWIIEFATYELPWFLYFVYFGMFGDPNLNFLIPSSLILFFAILLWVVSIIRAFWIAVKLADVYDNEEKYIIQTTQLTKPANHEEEDNLKSNLGCCLCIIAVFILFVIVVL